LIGVEAGRLLGDQRHRWDPAAKRSGSSDAPGKAPSRNGNQPYAMMMILFYSTKTDSATKPL